MERGRLDTFATFTQRMPKANTSGQSLSNSFSKFYGCMAQFRAVTGAEQAQNGRLEDVRMAILRISDSPLARKITSAHRVVLRGRSWAIKSVADPDRRTGLIEMNISDAKAG